MVDPQLIRRHTGFLISVAIATKKVTTLQVNKPLTIAAERNTSAKRRKAV
jgi:hypothetical protein